MNKNLVD